MRLGGAGDGDRANPAGVNRRAVMSLVRRFTRGLHALVFRSRVERELDAELRAFLDAAIEAKMRDGASRADAERAARLELGSAAAVKDHVRDAGWESTVESFRQDVR